MSIRTWMEEFYSKTARDVVAKAADKYGSTSPKTLLKAIDHSLVKYEGTKAKNLRKHDVVVIDGDLLPARVTDTNRDDVSAGFAFDDETCALCIIHDSDCSSCPIVQSGGMSCLSGGSPFVQFVRTDDGKSVRAALKKAKKYVKQLNVK